MSAVIPCYNGAAFVEAAIASALAQSHHLLEVIVVDDGSQDDSAEVARRYPVKVIRVPNGGPGAARNRGVAESAGEWIAFLDHDDCWLPHKIAAQLDMASETTGIVCCPLSDLHDYAACPATPPRPGGLVTFPQLWLYNVVGSPSGVVMRRRTFEEVEGFDLDPELVGAEDYNLWLRVALAGWEIQAGPPDVFRYTPAHGSLSSQTLRMYRSSLRNIELIARLCGMSEQDIEPRRRFAHLDTVRLFLKYGDRAAARRLLRNVPLDAEVARLWIAATAPESITARFRRRRSPRRA